MKAISLVVISKGNAFLYAPQHTDTRIVDLDNIMAGDPPVCLPKGVGFEELVKEADVLPFVEFVDE